MGQSGERTHESRSASRSVVVAAGLVFFLVSAELALGIWARHARTPYEDFDRVRRTPTLVPGRYATPYGEVEIDARGFVARRPRDRTGALTNDIDRELADEGSQLLRILALGDSCTFGAGDAESTYPAALERRLDSRPANPSIARATGSIVINAGIAGLRSDEALGRLAYAISVVHPDVVTIYLGWNDLMKDSPRAQTRASHLSAFWRALDDLWLARGLRKLLFFHLRARFGTPRIGPAGETGRFADFRPDYFEANLHRLVAETRKAGARLLLVTLPHSLRRDLSPMELLEPSRQYPYFYAGNALGDFVDLIERYNETIHRVAQAEAVPVAEVAERFDRMTRKEDYFLDTMHPNRRGNALIAEVLERTLREQQMLERSTKAVASGREE